MPRRSISTRVSIALLTVALLFMLQGCKSSFETNVDLTEASSPSEDSPYVASGFQDKILIGDLDIDAPKKGARITLRGKTTTYIYGAAYHSQTKNSYILEQDTEPLIVSALSHVFETSSTHRRQAYVVPEYRFKPEQHQNFWHKYVVLAALMDLHVVVKDGKRVLYDRHIHSAAQEDYSLLVQLYPSGDMINRLMQESLRKAVLRLSEDEDFRALSKAGTI